MDLGSRLANLSLAQIADMLDPKQQEVLLASISVAAKFIQQLQAEEQLHQQQQQQHQQQEQQLNLNLNQQQQQSAQLLAQALKREHLNHSSTTGQLNNQHQIHQQHGDYEGDSDEPDEDEGHEDLESRPLNGDEDQETLDTIRNFADELKYRRKAIRLSQKGAAQSLRAFTNGEQPCTDAIIYHFENLQLEPDRAMHLIPLLRDWLEWAEKHRAMGKQLPMMSAVTKVPRERKRKVVLFNEKAKQYLEDAFLKNNHPDRYQLDVISQELSIPTRSIRKWFTNRRQRKRFAEKFSPADKA